MIPIIGERYLITTDDWFIAPDGEQYRAVFGTVHGVQGDQETLGIKTNSKSTNWYLSIGNMFIAGCQIHYAVKTDSVSLRSPLRTIEHDGQLSFARGKVSYIYNANDE